MGISPKNVRRAFLERDYLKDVHMSSPSHSLCPLVFYHPPCQFLEFLPEQCTHRPPWRLFYWPKAKCMSRCGNMLLLIGERNLSCCFCRASPEQPSKELCGFDNYPRQRRESLSTLGLPFLPQTIPLAYTAIVTVPIINHKQTSVDLTNHSTISIHYEER